MADDPLNSMHLDMGLRDQFREARAGVLKANGTKLVEKSSDSGPPPLDSKTLLEGLGARMPPGQDYALVDQENVYPLKAGINTIGRLSDNDLVLNDPYVSRRHCAIVIHSESGTVEVHDVASKNGTYLNGIRLTEPAPLKTGDEVRLCERPLIFVARVQQPAPTGDSATQVP